MPGCGRSSPRRSGGARSSISIPTSADVVGGLAFLGGLLIARAGDPDATRAALGQALEAMLRGWLQTGSDPSAHRTGLDNPHTVGMLDTHGI